MNTNLLYKSNYILRKGGLHGIIAALLIYYSSKVLYYDSPNKGLVFIPYGPTPCLDG